MLQSRRLIRWKPSSWTTKVLTNFYGTRSVPLSIHAFASKISMIRRRTRVWALAPKPKSVDASFLFSPYGEVPSHEILPQKVTFLFWCLIRLLVKFVVLQSHSQSICVLNQSNTKINNHLVSHIETFCLFPLIFYPHLKKQQ